MRAKICSAINLRKLIEFYYEGEPRLVEPFCCGIHKNTSNEVLRGYQVSGHGKSGEPVGWKLYRVDEISELVITDQHFSGIRDYYNPDDSAMKTIYCHV